MGLFGMMNWLYTWYNPRVDPDAETLAREMSDLFLEGVRGGNSGNSKVKAVVRTEETERRVKKRTPPRKAVPAGRRSRT